MSDLNKEFDKLFHNSHKKLNEFLYKVIKEYGEKLYDEWNNECWYIDALELRLFYDGEQTKVIEYEYIFQGEDLSDEYLENIGDYINDIPEEQKWKEDEHGNFHRTVINKCDEYLDKIDEYIFEKQSLDKKINVIMEILK